jgi:hypothetical protein
MAHIFIYIYIYNKLRVMAVESIYLNLFIISGSYFLYIFRYLFTVCII